MAPAGIGDSVEGVHAVGAAVDAGRVEVLLVETRRLDSPEIAGIVARARSRGCVVEEVRDVRPEAATSAPQGVVARCRPRRAALLEELVDPKPAALVLLDHVQDSYNVGAVARSALAAGMTGLVVPQRRAAPLGAAAFKAAAGALERLRVCVVSSVAAALSTLEGLGVWVVGLDAGGDRSLFDLDLLAEPVAVVIGTEATGLARLVRQRCDLVASIPMAGPAESLNASVAAALACYEVMRVRAGA